MIFIKFYGFELAVDSDRLLMLMLLITIELILAMITASKFKNGRTTKP
jgi:hypothetical protein